jgi:predicted ATP-grasp superfamily ATP-dependent carboligase
LFAKHDLQVSGSLAAKWLEEALRSPWPTLADVSPTGTIIEAGRPILTVFAEGADADEVLANLKSRVALIEREIYVN